jgi:hypothetical protein
MLSISRSKNAHLLWTREAPSQTVRSVPRFLSLPITWGLCPMDDPNGRFRYGFDTGEKQALRARSRFECRTGSALLAA